MSNIKDSIKDKYNEIFRKMKKFYGKDLINQPDLVLTRKTFYPYMEENEDLKSLGYLKIIAQNDVNLIVRVTSCGIIIIHEDIIEMIAKDKGDKMTEVLIVACLMHELNHHFQIMMNNDYNYYVADGEDIRIDRRIPEMLKGIEKDAVKKLCEFIDTCYGDNAIFKKLKEIEIKEFDACYNNTSDCTELLYDELSTILN